MKFWLLLFLGLEALSIVNGYKKRSNDENNIFVVDNAMMILLTDQLDTLLHKLDLIIEPLEHQPIHSPQLFWISESRNVYSTLRELIDSLDGIYCGFDDKFVDRIERAFNSYPFTRDNHQNVIQNMRDYPKYAHESTCPLKDTFMQIKSSKIDELLKKAENNFQELSFDVRDQIFELLKCHATAINGKKVEINNLVAKFETHIKKRRDDSIKIRQTASEIESIIYGKYDDEARQKEIKTRIANLQPYWKAEKGKALVTLSTKVREHKTAINDIIALVHQQFEGMPEQLEDLIVFETTYAYDIAEFKKTVEKYLSNGLQKVINFQKNQRTEEVSIEWIGIWENSFPLTSSILDKINFRLLRFGPKDIKNMENIIDANPAIKYKPLYTGLIEILKRYYEKTASGLIASCCAVNVEVIKLL